MYNIYWNNFSWTKGTCSSRGTLNRVVPLSMLHLHAERSIIPLSQRTKQFLSSPLASSKNVFSIWRCISFMFSWNCTTGINNKKENYTMHVSQLVVNAHIFPSTNPSSSLHTCKNTDYNNWCWQYPGLHVRSMILTSFILVFATWCYNSCNYNTYSCQDCVVLLQTASISTYWYKWAVVLASWLYEGGRS